MKIFSGISNKPLAEKIAREVHVPFSRVEEFVFPDGERRVRIAENVVEEHCVIVQSTSTPVDEHYMELFFLIDGLRRSGASQITAVVPYFGYQRQDHVFRDGEAVSLEVIIKILGSLKIDRLVSVDMHASRIPDLFPDTIAVTHLSALPLFAEKIKEILTRDTRNSKRETPSFNINLQDQVSRLQNQASAFSHAVLVSPDMGGIRRIKQLSELLGGMSWAAIEKNRDLETGRLQENRIGEGSVDGKTIGIIVDDMISSGGTVVKAARLLEQFGINELYAFATHAVFSSDAPQLLQTSSVKKVYVTDTVLVPEEKKFKKLEIISIADSIAKEIKNL